MKFVFSLLFSILSALCFVLAWMASKDRIVSWGWRLGFSSVFTFVGLLSLGLNVFILDHWDS